MMGTTRLDRRAALTLIGGGVAVAATGSAAAGPTGRVDFADPAERLRAYILMRGALDDRLVIGCVQGQYFGVVDGAATPLFGIVAATFARYRRRPDGGYDVANGEAAWFTDLATGQAMDRWANPYTGETVAVPPGGLPPATFAILPDFTFRLSRPMPGGKFDHHIQAAQVRGDDVWIPELTITAASIPGAGAFHYSEVTTLHARRSDLERRGAKQVGCDTGFTNVVSWRPWMKMGTRPGHMMAAGAGRYGATLQTLPPALLSALQEKRPELLRNPASLIDPLWR